MKASSNTTLPDLRSGLPLAAIEDGGLLAGRAGRRPILVWRKGNDLHAYSATCPHLGGPLQEGIVEGGIIRCPWHHACFDLQTGAARSAPAFDALPRYKVQLSNKRFRVTGQDSGQPPGRRPAAPTDVGAMLIVGGGAAGFGAAEALRQRGWAGEIVMISCEADEPYDRTLLTKDYLDGRFGDDRLGVAGHSLRALGVRLELRQRAKAIDVRNRLVRLSNGREEPYGKLLLATGAAPHVPDLPGITHPNVHVLRSLSDCRRLLSALDTAQHIVVLGGSFIGLEAAASLRSRGHSVDVIAPEKHPMERVFGRALSDVIVGVHRQKGVALHLGRSISAIEADSVMLDDRTSLPADIVVVGTGVVPRTDLAEGAGLRLDRGVLVDEHLRTSAPDIYAAGDIARWPDPHSGRSVRVEHWVVAERQGQTAAANMLDAGQRFEMVPFFWTKHFDLSIRYVGHAEHWDDLIVEGEPTHRDALIRFRQKGRDLAIATVGRDFESLKAELAMEQRLEDERRVAQQRPA